MLVNRDKAIKKFRNAVLIAFDEAAAEVFELHDVRAPGADPEDLDAIHDFIEDQVERIAERHGITLTDEEVEED